MPNDASPSQREHWSGSLGFVLAAAGSAVGLGNIWKFPYVSGENGGGAFVLVYLACVAAIGIPVMLCEITIGRHTQRNPVGAFRALSPANSLLAHLIGLGMILAGIFLLAFQSWGWALLCLAIGGLVFRYGWRMVGGMGVLAGFVILSFYSVVGGWTLGYMIEMLRTLFSGGIAGTHALSHFAASGDSVARFEELAGNPWWNLRYHAVFMALCISIVMVGVRRGIERLSRILMPLLLFLLLVLIVRGLSLPGAREGVRFFLTPDFGKINTTGVLTAMGLAFFSLSLGMGAMITYGSYVNRDQNLFQATLGVVGLDVLIALMAGLAIFPAVFATGVAPSEGPGLVFVLLPTVFMRIPAGAFWGLLFFLLLVVAAWTSGISLLEVVTAYFVDERGWSRRLATLVFGGTIFSLGALSAISPGVGEQGGWQRLEGLRRIFVTGFGTVPSDFLSLADKISSEWLLTLGGVLIALFVGWIWGTRSALDEIRHGSHNFGDVHFFSLLAGLRDDPSHNSEVHAVTLASIWGVFVRFICPVAILIAFLHTIGWLKLPPVEPRDPRPDPPPAALADEF